MPLPSLDLGKTYLLRIDLLPSLRMAAKTQKLILKREVGLIGAISFIAGTMMGSGIFMSPQSVLVNIGSPKASLVIWAGCSMQATLGSLCSEVGSNVLQITVTCTKVHFWRNLCFF